MMKILKPNFWEIDRSSCLQNFGAILSLLHMFNYLFWNSQGHIFSAPNALPLMCWSLVPHCERNPLLQHPTLLSFLFSTYFILAMVSLLAFIWRRFVGLSWFALAFTNLIMIVFYLSDSSLSQDIYSLFLILNFTFLLIPGKALIIRSAVIFFYFVSGLRELNPETLSGVGMHEWVQYPYKILEWIAALGIAMKITLPALLISPIGQRVTLAALGLSTYHVFYLYYLHDFKSLVLLGMIIFFIFDFFSKKRLEIETLYQSYAHPEPSKLWWVGVMGLYIFLQTPLFGKNSTDRLLYIAEPLPPQTCHLITFANYKSYAEHFESDFNRDLKGPTRCHPVIAFNSAKELCTKLGAKPDFLSLNASFVSRRLSQTTSSTVFSFQNICSKDVEFKLNPVEAQK